MDMHAHLLSRHLDPSRYQCHLSDEVVCFWLFNLSGQLVGYQQYRPFATKKLDNRPEGRYFTCLHNQLGVWGMETFYYRDDVLFVVEGVFDACRLHNLGLPAVAVLGNHPKPLLSWLYALPRKVVVVADDDKAGQNLHRYGTEVLVATNHDLGDMSDAEVRSLLSAYL